MAQMAGRGLGVIEPKLIPPRVHAGTLRRDRLLRLLGDHPATPLTMLNAGVGYGKTTLVRSWCVERPEAVIWVSLDAADDDPVRCGRTSPRRRNVSITVWDVPR
jgi:LuxR family transcriptional regulator, maltose regulon positive regulatory protein